MTYDHVNILLSMCLNGNKLLHKSQDTIILYITMFI